MGTSYSICGKSIVKVDPQDKDARGLLFLWEKPTTTATYVVGVDPTQGIEGWRRELRTQDDAKTDNAAIEVIKVADIEHGGRDVQVAEYAAPIDYAQLAQMVNLLGRLYCGNVEDGQALVIMETNSIGIAAQRELIALGYLNLYRQPYLDTLVPQGRRGSPFGWWASRQTVSLLWAKGLHHISKRHILLRSPWLIDEMADCEPDERLMAMRAAFGRHDDRVRALLLTLWAAHDWSSPIEFQPTKVEQAPAPPWQASACSVDTMYREWEERFASLLD